MSGSICCWSGCDRRGVGSSNTWSTCWDWPSAWCSCGTASRVTVDAYESNIVIYNQLATPEWLLFVVVPFASTLLAIEFALRIRRTYRTGEADLDRHLRHGF